MNYFSKIGVFCLLFFAFALAARAQTDWTGAYEFDEDGGQTTVGTAIFITHQLEVKQTDDGLVAYLQSNGFQTSKDLICTAKTEGDKLLIYFESYGENNVFESYEEGDLLLTLESKTAKNKTEILTFWNKFQPVVTKNEKSGQLYFKKIGQIKKK
ncbi:MAG TPA: DUF5991 domain-containing protein [Pyrinomonadaceae bacterium]|jgi:hypothetical protein